MKKEIALWLLLFIITPISCKENKNTTKQSVELASQEIKADNFLKEKIYYILPISDRDMNLIEEIWTESTNTTEDYIYGIFIHFKDSLHYNKFYTAPCGNDCFFSDYGKYYLPASDILVLQMDSILYWGECQQPTVYGNGKNQMYTITKNEADSAFKLIPIHQ